MTTAAPSSVVRGPWRSLGMAVVYVIVLVASIAIAGGIAGWASGSTTTPPAVLSPVPWLVTIAVVLVAHAVMLYLVDRRPWSDVGLGRRNVGLRRSAAGLAVGALAVGIPCVVLLLSGWLTIAPGVGGNVGTNTVRLLALLVPAALAEELMVRGYLLTVLADGFGRAAAVIVTSLLFALLHFANPGATVWSLLVVALAGIWLGVVRLATDSLYAAWAAHLAWNFVLAGVLHAAVSGQDMTIVGWRTIDSGPDWATGGAWGPEGGLAAVTGLVLATVLLIVRPFARGNGNRVFAQKTRGESTA